jgi:peptidoglycan/LPS O-acetylase OafA/YrhL
MVRGALHGCDAQHSPLDAPGSLHGKPMNDISPRAPSLHDDAMSVDDRPTARRQPIPALTGLRFIAAMTILVSHSLGVMVRIPGGPMPAWQLYLTSLSGLGMPLFFVLSGFVIQYNYSDRVTGGARGIWNFFAARFARLYPLYICAIAFEFVYSGSYGQLPPSTGQALPYYLTLTQSWFYVVVDDMTLIFRFWVISQVSWSISTEWFFYLAYPFIGLALARLTTPRQTWLAMLATAVIASAVLLAVDLNTIAINHAARAHFGDIAVKNNQSFRFWLVYFSPYSRIFEFLIGALVAVLYGQVKDRPFTRAQARAGLLAMIGAIVAALLLIWLFYVAPTYPLVETDVRILTAARNVLSACFGFAPAIAVVVFCCARYKNPIVSALSAPLIVLGGEASYSLYLLHEVVINAFRNLALSDSVTLALGIGNALMWLVAMLSAVGLSLVTWRLLEVPARRWLRRALTVKPSPAIAQVSSL